jgi:hypothetical protein
MATNLYKLNKNTLNLTSSIALFIEDVKNISIPHIFSQNTHYAKTINFSLTILNDYVPELKEEEFMIAIRDKLDVLSIGSNDNSINKLGKDKGNIDRHIPEKPLELPIGFKELKGE